MALELFVGEFPGDNGYGERCIIVDTVVGRPVSKILATDEANDFLEWVEAQELRSVINAPPALPAELLFETWCAEGGPDVE